MIKILNTDLMSKSKLYRNAKKITKQIIIIEASNKKFIIETKI